MRDVHHIKSVSTSPPPKKRKSISAEHDGDAIIEFMETEFESLDDMDIDTNLDVDDLFMAGNTNFRKMISEQILHMFKFSKVEENKFKYLGCEVVKHLNGDISLNQNAYIEKLDEVDIPSGRNSWKVSEAERKIIRKVVGELLWISLMTRPDLSFEVNRLSGLIYCKQQ